MPKESEEDSFGIFSLGCPLGKNLQEKKEGVTVRKVVLYVAMSLDGYLARGNGAVDWLHSEDQEEEASSFDAFYDTVDTLIMGRKTFTQVVEELSPDQWVYEGKKCLVYTREKREKDPRVTWIHGDLSSLVKVLKQQDGKDIWLVGGAELYRAFAEEDLIDTYILTVMPRILGKGMPSFFQVMRKQPFN